MKNYKLIRNMWLISGCIWIIVLTLNVASDGWLLLLILNSAAAIFSFVLVFIYNNKIKKEA